MEAGSATATDRLSNALVAENSTHKLSKRASLSKGMNKTGIPQDKSFTKGLDRMRISRSNSENVPFDNSVRKYGSESILVTPNVPLPTGPAILVGDEEGTDGQSNNQFPETLPGLDEEKTLQTRNTIILNESAKISRIPEQDSNVYLKAKVKELREDNHRLSRKLLDEAEISVQLKEENKILLDELKRKCGPDIISFLEAQNPDRSTQSDDMIKANSESLGSPSDCNFFPDQCIEAISQEYHRTNFD